MSSGDPGAGIRKGALRECFRGICRSGCAGAGWNGLPGVSSDSSGISAAWVLGTGSLRADGLCILQKLDCLCLSGASGAYVSVL